MDISVDKISVIVPVYKVEEYLDECVESILRQSYSNFELILVDDGSPDRCDTDVLQVRFRVFRFPSDTG